MLQQQNSTPVVDEALRDVDEILVHVRGAQRGRCIKVHGISRRSHVGIGSIAAQRTGIVYTADVGDFQPLAGFFRGLRVFGI